MKASSTTKKQLLEEVERLNRRIDELKARLNRSAGPMDLTRRLSTMLKNLPAGIIVEKPDRTITLINPRACEIFGLETPCETLIGTNGSEIAHRSKNLFLDPKAVEDQATEICRKGQPVYGDEFFLKDGRVFERDFLPVQIAPGVVEHVWRYHEITGQKKAEQARHESERRLTSLMNNLPGMAYRCRNDPEWTMEFVSDGCLALTGYHPEQIIDNRDRSYGEIIHPEDRENVWTAVQRMRETGDSFELEYRIRMDDGTIKWVWEQGQHVPGDKKGISLVEGLIIDVTERKRLEEQLIQARKMEAIGQLAGGIAHDFNNLLTIIGLNCELLNREGLSEDLKDPVDQIIIASDKATRLVSQLLTFSKKQVIRPQVINLNDIVREEVNLLKRLLDENILVSTNLDNNINNVRADPGQIDQIILNLAVNARDAMRNGGTLTIETSNVAFSDSQPDTHPGIRHGDYVMLAVTDTGSGMDVETKERIFDPFFTTKEREKGTGLGLSTVYGIVKQSKGFIYVYSELDKGTTIKVYLPATDQSVPAPAQPAGQRTAGGDETILLVEDNSDILELTRIVLEDYGYSVLTAGDGEQALHISREHPGSVDLLLTDVIMPRMNGREVADKLSSEYPDLKIIYFSGYTDSSIVHHGVTGEGVQFLQKPYSPVELAKKIRETLDR